MPGGKGEKQEGKKGREKKKGGKGEEQAHSYAGADRLGS